MKDDIYKQYCIHNQPIYYRDCSGCKAIKELEAKRRYQAYWKKKHLTFGTILKKHLAEILKIQVINMNYQKNLIV